MSTNTAIKDLEFIMVVFLCRSSLQNYVIFLSPYEIYTTCQQLKNFGSEGAVRVGMEKTDESKWLCSSLVPRPFPPPVFDPLQYAKLVGGRPGRKSHVRDVR